MSNSSDTALAPLLEAAQVSRSASFSTIRAIILKVLSDSQVFAGYNQIQQIVYPALTQAGAEGAKLQHTLELFSYGLYSDYQQKQGSDYFMDLSDAQILKLRQLTCMTTVQSYVHQQKTLQVPLTVLQQALDVPSTKAVEEVIISCLYAEVLQGKLCQKRRAFVVSLKGCPAARDVPLSQLSEMANTLQVFSQRLQQANDNLSQTHASVLKELQTSWQNLQVSDQKSRSTAAAASPSLPLRSEDSTPRRQKRSRGGLGGGTDPFGYERLHV
jgi:COP9 signalosome complex subunit 7